MPRLSSGNFLRLLDMTQRTEFPPLRWASLAECAAPPEGWAVRPFGSVARVIAGQSPRSDTYNERGDGLPFLQGNADFTDRHPSATLWCSAPKKTAEPGSTLISVRAPVGEVNQADQIYAIGRGLAALEATGCDPDFLYYAMQRWRWCLQRVAQGTTFDAVTARHFALLRVALPDDPIEQQAIAGLLTRVDRVLECTRGLIARAQEIERSVMEAAFANLDAERQPLRYFITEVRYGTSKASNGNGWGNPVLRIPNVVSDRLRLDDIAFVELPEPEINRLTLRSGDLLLVRTNGNPRYVGRSTVFRQPDDQVWLYASYLIRVRLRDTLMPDFVNLFLGTQRGRQELLRRVTTSAGNHNINSNSIRLIQIPVPNVFDDQEAIVTLATACRRAVDAHLEKESALKELKRTLMENVLTGSVRLHRPVTALTA
jgi:type I restriction enzyme S subunit